MKLSLRVFGILTLTVLLMATFCLSAAAQGNWTLHRKFSEPSDISAFWCVEFVDNSTVIIGAQRYGRVSRGRLYKWNFATGARRSQNIDSVVTGLAIGGDTNYVMYTKIDGKVGSRYTSDLSWREGITTGFRPGTSVQLAFADPRYGYENLVIGGSIPTTPRWKAQYQIWKVATPGFTRLNVKTDNNRSYVVDLETSKYVNEFFVADNDSNADIFGTDLSWKWDSGPSNGSETAESLAFNWETDSDRLAVGYSDGSIKIYRYKN